MPPEPATPEQGQQQAAPPVLSRRKMRMTALMAAALAAIVVIMGVTTRRMADARLVDWTEKQAVPTVAIAMPDERGRRTTIDLPGRPEA